MRVRRLGTAILTMALVAAFAAGCGDDDAGGDAKDAAPKAGATTSTATGTGTMTATTEDEGGSGKRAAVTREVTVQDGAVEGGPQAIRVEVGENVTLTVTSDVADEIHVHGVDVSRDVEAGGTATVNFTPDTPGSYEIELEESGTLIASLEVR